MEHHFICPAKTAAGSHSLAHLPFELFSAGAAGPMVLVDQARTESPAVAALKRAFNDSNLPLALAEVDPADPASLKQIYTWYREGGCDALVVLGTGPLVNLAKQLLLILARGPEILRHPLNDIPPRDPALKAAPFFLLPTSPGPARDTGGTLVHKEETFTSSYLVPDLVCISPELMAPDLPLEAILDAGFSALAVCGEVLARLDNPLARPYAHLGLTQVAAHFQPLVRFSLQPPPRAKADKAAILNHQATLTQATTAAGYLLTNFPDLECLSALPAPGGISPGQAMALHLAEHIDGYPTPDALLLPLAGMETFAATPSDQHGDKARVMVRDLFNTLYARSGGQIPRTPADLTTPNAEVPCD